MDVNEEKPEYPIPLNKVGVKDIHIPFYTLIGGDKVNTILHISAYIDLPYNLRGIHASRSLESIIESIVEYRNKFMKIEDIALNISRELLRRHPYSKKARVYGYGDIVLRYKTPSTNKVSLEKMRIYGYGYSDRSGEDISFKRFIGVRVSGLTACPSAMESTRRYLKASSDLTPTHIQRGYLTIIIEEPLDMQIDIMDLINLARDSFSSATYELLKKEDEARIIINAYEKPLFTEDVVRLILYKLYREYHRMGNLRIYVKYESLESIHNHNLVAYFRGYMDDVGEWIKK